MNNKLFIIEGINGLRRQELAQQLYYSIGENNSVWISEESDNNILILDKYRICPWELNLRIPEEDINSIKSNLVSWWIELKNIISLSNKIYILDGILFEKNLRILYQNNVEEEIIYSLFKKIINEINELQPHLIYFSTYDFAAQLQNEFIRNGTKWEKHIVNDVWGTCRKMDNVQLVFCFFQIA